MTKEDHIKIRTVGKRLREDEAFLEGFLGDISTLRKGIEALERRVGIHLARLQATAHLANERAKGTVEPAEPAGTDAEDAPAATDGTDAEDAPADRRRGLRLAESE